MKKKILLAAAAAATLMAPLAAPTAHAQDIGGYIGELRIFPYGGNNAWCPRGWARTDGQLLAISSNSALFSLYGTTWGGDGRTTFGLPELRGRVIMGVGDGPGLTPRIWGQTTGVEGVNLTVSEMPNHNHNIRAISLDGNTLTLSNATWGSYTSSSFDAYNNSNNFNAQARTDTIGNNGGSQAHPNIQPVQVLQHCVSLNMGIYPPRS